MQKWEYLFLTHSASRHGKGETRIDVDPDSSSEQSLAEFFGECNRLGSEGWELVGLSKEDRLFLLTFKRPKE